MTINSTLRDYQITAINRLWREIRGGSMRPVLQLPTGAGKTIVASAIVDMARNHDKRILFVVPAISLIDQTVQAFWRENLTDVGVMQADHEMTDPSQPIQVCSIDTLARRAIPPADCVIVDECHRRSKFRDEWMADPDWQFVPFIGLSATPWAAAMADHWSSLIVMATTGDMIDAGHLSPFEVFAPSHPDLSDVKITAGDYQVDQLGEAMSDGALVADIVSTWLELGRDEPTLCFCVNCAHAQHVQAAFLAAGVPTAYQDAKTSREDREQIAKDFHNGDVKVVCNVGTLTTGVDWDVRCLILARPTRSKILFVQIIGRALRTAPGKVAARILDHSDTHLRLGLVTDIYADKLSDGKHEAGSGSQDREEPLPKECPRCAFLKPPRVRECPNCGFVSQAPMTVDTLEGELVQITGKGTAGPKHQYEPAEKRIWHAELLGLVRERGYKPGWAAHKYREKFGHFPPRGDEPEPVTPGMKVRSYVKSRMIAWIKAKEKDQSDDGSEGLS